MVLTRRALTRCVWLLLLQQPRWSAAAVDYTFVADLTQPQVQVDRTPVGATLEDTSFSLYGGGLYSQLIYGEGFEEPRLEGAPGSARGAPAPQYLTWASAVKSSCHRLIPGTSRAPADRPFTGRQSLRLNATNGTCMVSNMGGGGDRWGIAIHNGHDYQGYLFSRGKGAMRVGLCPGLHSDGGLTPPSACYTSALLAPPSPAAITANGWTQRTFALTPNTSDPAGSFVVWLEGGTTDVDAVFLEDRANLFPGAQHVRRDLAEATLLNGTFQFLRFGGDMAGRSSYKWRTMRGPAWLRPPQTPGSWSPYSSNGFGMFEFLQFREAAGIERVILGTSSGLPNKALGKCADPADNTTEMEDLAEYLFAPVDRGGALAALRQIDGHAPPYDDRGLVIEIGNECKCAESYFPSLNKTIAAIVGRVRRTAPHVGLLRFASMAGVIMERDCTPQENAALAALVKYWATRNVQLLSDQHIPSQSFGEVLQTIANITAMVDDMRGDKGATNFSFFVGEENCATEKTVPNNPLCHGIGRALQHALYGNALHRMGNNTCLGVASATLYGASGRQFEWPQAGIEFTPSAVLLQPPYLAKQMVGSSFRSRVVQTTPTRFTSSGCVCNSSTDCMASSCEVVDLLLLTGRDHQDADAAAGASTSSMVIRMVSSANRSLQVALDLSTAEEHLISIPAGDVRTPRVDLGSRWLSQSTWACETLACGSNLTAANSLEHPAACSPRNLTTGATVGEQSSVLLFSLPAFSFTVCTQQPGV